MITTPIRAAALGALTCGLALPVSAQIDPAKPLICAAVEANDCAPGVRCLASPPQDINIPQFVRIDLAANRIMARGRSTAIGHHVRANGVIFVHGSENRRAWSLTIDEATGRLVGAIAGDEEGFVIFGACEAL